MKQIPLAKYEPDRVLLNENKTNLLNNVFIDNEGNLINVSGSRKVAPQPLDDRLESLFASPSLSGDFNIFGGGSKGLYIWSNIDSNWIKVYSSLNENPSVSSRWIIKDFNTIILATKEGEGLLYFNREKNEFESVRNNPSYDEGESPSVRVEDIGAMYVTEDCVIVWEITNLPNRVAWSGIKDCFNWNTEATSGNDDIMLGGGVRAIIGGSSNPFIFTLRMTYRMYRTGSEDTLWSFKQISPSIGVNGYKDCTENREGTVYIIDTQSMYMFTIDEQIKDIGRYRVANTWTYTTDMKVIADVLSRRIYYVYPGKGTLIYTEYDDVWSTMDHEGLDVFIGNFETSSLDNTEVNEQYESICLIPYSLDSVQDVYSCSLALSNDDGIYLIDNNTKLIADISSGIISNAETNLKIQNIRSVTDSDLVTNIIDYGYNYNLTNTTTIYQNSFGYSNISIRCGQYRLSSKCSFDKYFLGWNINTKAGVNK